MPRNGSETRKGGKFGGEERQNYGWARRTWKAVSSASKLFFGEVEQPHNNDYDSRFS
jgi:hypothetical protein